MFGWKGYGFAEKATKDNLNGKGEIWNLIKSWRPFIKYERTDLIKEKATGEIKYTIDLVKCPKWVAEAINRTIQLRHPELHTTECTYDSETHKLTKNGS